MRRWEKQSLKEAKDGMWWRWWQKAGHICHCFKRGICEKSIFLAGVKSKSLEVMENKVMWEQFFMCEKLNLTTSIQASFEKCQYQLPQQIFIRLLHR